MYTRSILLYLGALAWLTQGAPLNINLGAYSPALVVVGGEAEGGQAEGGQAEGGAEGAEGAAGAGEAGAGTAEGGTGTGQEETETGAGQEVETPEANASVIPAAQDVSALQGMGKQRLPKDRS
ncbi:hypothetical protein UCDDA912_g10450 [Diaporthe ampelina]|uniref:Uncharacterized protein n=1 Tax=Diaporthe ampelina TaxID=1214573 RepID=A0A0G2HMY1_9PEZI|nr:hypothetical protein UCDDA912_g10450 [Diaporthe ampelina]